MIAPKDSDRSVRALADPSARLDFLFRGLLFLGVIFEHSFKTLIAP